MQVLIITMALIMVVTIHQVLTTVAVLMVQVVVQHYKVVLVAVAHNQAAAVAVATLAAVAAAVLVVQVQVVVVVHIILAETQVMQLHQIHQQQVIKIVDTHFGNQIGVAVHQQVNLLYNFRRK